MGLFLDLPFDCANRTRMLGSFVVIAIFGAVNFDPSSLHYCLGFLRWNISFINQFPLGFNLIEDS
jgi:hypothetical protein